MKYRLKVDKNCHITKRLESAIIQAGRILEIAKPLREASCEPSLEYGLGMLNDGEGNEDLIGQFSESASKRGVSASLDRLKNRQNENKLNVRN